MATHTKDDIDKLTTAIEEVWNENNCAIEKRKINLYAA
jgi:hypothetical protein